MHLFFLIQSNLILILCIDDQEFEANLYYIFINYIFENYILNYIYVFSCNIIKVIIYIYVMLLNIVKKSKFIICDMFLQFFLLVVVFFFCFFLLLFFFFFALCIRIHIPRIKEYVKNLLRKDIKDFIFYKN